MHSDKKYIPDMAVFEITSRCNLKCIHCYSSSGKAKPNELTTKEALQLCEDLDKINSKEVCLLGGEPFLRKDWHIIGKKVKDLGMKLSLISNGFIINKEIVSRLVDLEPCEISLSLDGASAKTHDYIRGVEGSFNKVFNSISLLTENNLPTSIITAVNKLNFKELPDMVNLLIGGNVKWNIQAAAPVGRFSKKYALSEDEFFTMGLFVVSIREKYSADEFPVIAAQCIGYNSHFAQKGFYPTDWNGCEGGISFISILSNGDIKGCLSLPDEYIEGNIRKRSVVDIWNDPNLFSYSRNFDKSRLGENCKGCKHGEKCRGGCLTMSIGRTGKPFNDPFCFYRIEKELLK